MAGAPDTRYAQNGDTFVAYQVSGRGPSDVVYVPTALHPIDLVWDDPVAARGLRRLAARHRLICCDLIGVGSSDPVLYADLPAMQTWADGFTAVLDAAGSESAAFIATAESCLPVLVFAASHPERVRALVLWAPYARFTRDDDHPAGMPTESLDDYLAAFVGVAGTGALVDFMAPSRAGDDWFRAWWARGERLSAGHGYFGRIVSLFLGSDVRAVLGAVQAPTVLVRRVDDWHVRAGHAEAMASAMPDARVVELPGADHVWFSGDTDAALDVVDEFLTGGRAPAPTNRALATVLFTDIVGSTARAAALGDAEWSLVLEAHDDLVRRRVAAYRGTVVNTTGDGVLATFDGPARAIECATDLVRSVRDLGLEIRSGLHTGEVEERDGDVHGIAVHVAARVMALAAAGEVLVSEAVPPLVLGSGLRFADRGRHVLKGVPDEWTVYRVVEAVSADAPG